jgi:hypothetical protein
MGDAGEGLIDTDSRLQERADELAQERAERRAGPLPDPAAHRALEALRLARADLDRQLQSATHEARRTTLMQALADIDARLSKL